jgi:hypothetical protein
MRYAIRLSRFCDVDPLNRDFDPNSPYPPGLISSYGEDYKLNCRGIYYRREFSIDKVVANRKVWVPSLPAPKLKDTPENRERLLRAHIFAESSRNNESWCKSEYAWEADAWSQVFGKMREDHCLAMYAYIWFELRQDFANSGIGTNEST